MSEKAGLRMIAASGTKINSYGQNVNRLKGRQLAFSGRGASGR